MVWRALVLFLLELTGPYDDIKVWVGNTLGDFTKVTSKVFCRVTHWTGFYVMKTSVMRELDNNRHLSILHIRHGEIKKQRDHDNSKSILKTSESVSKPVILWYHNMGMSNPTISTLKLLKPWEKRQIECN